MKKIISFSVIGIYALYLLYVRQRPAALPLAASVSVVFAPPPASSSLLPYHDGEYTGKSENAYYGYVQVKAVVRGGRLDRVQILDYPSDRRTSENINSQALPHLVSQALQLQSAQVDAVTGATQTSKAFIKSLSSALTQAM